MEVWPLGKPSWRSLSLILAAVLELILYFLLSFFKMLKHLKQVLINLIC